MRTDRSDMKSDSSYFYFYPWRYCSQCGMCHSDKMKYCRRDFDEYKKDYYKNSDRYENKGRYHHDKDDGYDGDSRREAESRHKKEEQFKREDWEKYARKHEEENRYEYDRTEKKLREYRQTHVHEFVGSTKLAEFDEDVHNHRIAGVTGEVIKVHGNHIHKVWTRTDFFDHFHYIEHFTGPAVYVDQENDVKAQSSESDMCDEPHVHFASGFTSRNDGHDHAYQLATLIDSPLLPEPDAG